MQFVEKKQCLYKKSHKKWQKGTLLICCSLVCLLDNKLFAFFSAKWSFMQFLFAKYWFSKKSQKCWSKFLHWNLFYSNSDFGKPFRPIQNNSTICSSFKFVAQCFSTHVPGNPVFNVFFWTIYCNLLIISDPRNYLFHFRGSARWKRLKTAAATTSNVRWILNWEIINKMHL